MSTVGNKVLLPPALIQPLAADDVASAVGRIAMGLRVNGTVEVGGPEQFRLDELVQLFLAERKDPREVVNDPHARYYVVELSERILVPGDDARLGETHSETWLRTVQSESFRRSTAVALPRLPGVKKGRVSAVEEVCRIGTDKSACRTYWQKSANCFRWEQGFIDSSTVRAVRM